MTRLLPWALRFVVFAFVLLSMLSFATSLHWTGEVLSNFRVQFLIASLVLWLVSVMAREIVATLVLLVCIGTHLYPIGPYLNLAPPAAIAAPWTDKTRILTLNLDGDDSDVGKVRKLVYTESPDVIVFTELYGPAHRTFFNELRKDWPYRLGPVFENPHEVLVMSRIPYVNAQVTRSRRSGNMVRIVRFCPDKDTAHDDCFTLIAAHPIRTQAHEPHQLWRNATLGVVAKAASKEDGRVIVAGDLNVTPWSPAFAALTEKGQLSDTGLGRGLTATWMTDNPLFGLWIDHILVGKCITVDQHRLGPAVGSDHYPVIADVHVADECRDGSPDHS